MIIEAINSYTNQANEVIALTLKDKFAYKVIVNDGLANLELAKTYMDLVAQIAYQCSIETGIPFQQMLRLGLLSIIKASKDLCSYQDFNLTDYMKQEITKAMVGGTI